MLGFQVRGSGEPTLLFLHFLGGSGREWAEVVDRLERRYCCVTIDLPGFGASQEQTDYSVAAMAGAVAEVIRLHAPRSWMLVGHSMGAKVALAIARDAEDGRDGLSGLSGLVLMAGSPPAPEPMDESRRKKMMGWFGGDAEQSRAEATEYIHKNVAETLDGAVEARAVEDVLRVKRAAWIAWLERGSREDWSERIGVLRTPALVLAGEKDADLGPDGQRTLMMPHLAFARMEVLRDARHLLPMERPAEVAALIVRQAEQAGRGAPAPAAAAEIDPAYRALIDSERVSAPTRAALLARAAVDDPGYAPVAITVEQMATLRAMIDRIIPQEAAAKIDVAARIDQRLGRNGGDGWRYAVLPEDAAAYRSGLDTLDHEAQSAYDRGFVALEAGQKDELLKRAGAGEFGDGLLRRIASGLGLGETPGERSLLGGEQMQRWFEDVRADAVQIYVAHPATLARMGYSGIADGGETETMRGFVQIGAGEREEWEPLPLTVEPVMPR